MRCRHCSRSSSTSVPGAKVVIRPAGQPDGMGKVGIQRRARAIGIVPEPAREPLPGDAHRHPGAPGRRGERADVADKRDDLRTQLGSQGGRSPAEPSNAPSTGPSPCLSGSSGTAAPWAPAIAPPQVVRHAQRSVSTPRARAATSAAGRLRTGRRTRRRAALPRPGYAPGAARRTAARATARRRSERRAPSRRRR